jgi:hypothetical protein
MKLELLTNTTVIDDAIRFVASNAAKTMEKSDTDKMVVIDEENHNYEQQQSMAITNSIF